jgi:hypothetical protein
VIESLFSLIVRTYDYCKVCGWWVKDCGHSQQ